MELSQAAPDVSPDVHSERSVLWVLIAESCPGDFHNLQQLCPTEF